MRRLGGVQATGATQAESLRRLRGARGASAHACSTGLSTGRRLMPMTARCGAAAPCRGATLHARVWTKTQLHRHARVWTKTQGRGRKLVAIQTVASARASNELMQSAVRAVLLQCRRRSRPSQNASTQRGCLPQRPDPCRHSLPLLWRPGQHHQLLTVWIVQSSCRASAGCVDYTAACASVWIATIFACQCSCTHSVCSTQPAASHNSPRVCNCLTVVAPRHCEAAPHRAFMGIK